MNAIVVIKVNTLFFMVVDFPFTAHNECDSRFYQYNLNDLQQHHHSIIRR